MERGQGQFDPTPVPVPQAMTSDQISEFRVNQ